MNTELSAEVISQWVESLCLSFQINNDYSDAFINGSANAFKQKGTIHHFLEVKAVQAYGRGSEQMMLLKY